MGMMKVLTGTTAMSEATMKNTASRLQKGCTMKAMIVGLLAVAALSGCGVGLDDPQGQQAVGSTTSAALMNNPAPGQPDLVKGTGYDPRTALPQDPIPLFDAKQGPGQPAPDPLAEHKPFK